MAKGARSEGVKGLAYLSGRQIGLNARFNQESIARREISRGIDSGAGAWTHYSVPQAAAFPPSSTQAPWRSLTPNPPPRGDSQARSCPAAQPCGARRGGSERLSGVPKKSAGNPAQPHAWPPVRQAFSRSQSGKRAFSASGQKASSGPEFGARRQCNRPHVRAKTRSSRLLHRSPCK